jgi:hypothetical protein
MLVNRPRPLPPADREEAPRTPEGIPLRWAVILVIALSVGFAVDARYGVIAAVVAVILIAAALNQIVRH